MAFYVHAWMLHTIHRCMESARPCCCTPSTCCATWLASWFVCLVAVWYERIALYCMYCFAHPMTQSVELQLRHPAAGEWSLLPAVLTSFLPSFSCIWHMQARTPLVALVDVDMLLSSTIYKNFQDEAYAKQIVEVRMGYDGILCSQLAGMRASYIHTS